MPLPVRFGRLGVVPDKFPFLATALRTFGPLHRNYSGYIYTVCCSKKEAKRLIYPRTNRNRSATNSQFIFIRNYEDMWKTVNAHRDPLARSDYASRLRLDDIAMEVKDVFPALLCFVNVRKEPGGFVESVSLLVTFRDAKNLVYYGRHLTH
jgi:hypothetical protein